MREVTTVERYELVMTLLRRKSDGSQESLKTDHADSIADHLAALTAYNKLVNAAVLYTSQANREENETC